jgi:hypothetical protein
MLNPLDLRGKKVYGVEQLKYTTQKSWVKGFSSFSKFQKPSEISIKTYNTHHEKSHISFVMTGPPISVKLMPAALTNPATTLPLEAPP